jgi:nickel superoxide dismutase
MMSGSKSKQGLNRENAEDLLNKVNRFAEIFWATKDIETENLLSPYPPSMPVVCPKLQSA